MLTHITKYRQKYRVRQADNTNSIQITELASQIAAVAIITPTYAINEDIRLTKEDTQRPNYSPFCAST